LHGENISKYFVFSAIAANYHKPMVIGNLSSRTMLVDFGDPKKSLGNPKKGCDTQFENRWPKEFIQICKMPTV
jgi:hypothetical protein